MTSNRWSNSAHNAVDTAHIPTGMKAVARAARYMRPKTVCVTRLLRLLKIGLGVLRDAIPAPIPRCRMSSGAMTVTMPMDSAGSTDGDRAHSKPCVASKNGNSRNNCKFNLRRRVPFGRRGFSLTIGPSQVILLPWHSRGRKRLPSRSIRRTTGCSPELHASVGSRVQNSFDSTLPLCSNSIDGIPSREALAACVH